MKILTFIVLPLTGILIIAGLELIALSKGIDGNCLALTYAIIGSIITGGTMKIWGKFQGKNLQIKIKGQK